MEEVGTLDILGEIQSLVSDKLQVVSYKWLSRNFSVSSNDAKRLLQEFVDQHGSELEVIYTLSGWLKNNTSIYHIQLVSKLMLEEVKKEFEDNCSIQVYSVQACIPKDPAVLWNAEFVQAEELFNQPSAVDNCLRDNRFCGVSNSFVKRNANGTSVGIASPRPKIAGVTLSSKSNVALQTPTDPQQKQGKVQQASLKVAVSPTVISPVVKSESNISDINALVGKPHTGKEKGNKKTVKNEKSSSVTGGSLANFWGRASAKSKPISPAEEANNVVLNPIVTAEAQICAREAIDTVSSDDDGQDVNHKRSSIGEGNRKRRVVFDFSDEEDDDENAINLASPDPPKRKLNHDSEHNSKTMVVEKNKLNFEEHKGDQLKIKQEKSNEKKSTLTPKGDTVVANKSNTIGISLPEKTQSCIPEDDVNQKDKATDGTTGLPKRRKVLKTRIDERGREVTEVVWEGEETKSENTDKKDTITDTFDNRPPVAKKSSPSLGTYAPSNAVGKAGAKKTGKGGGGVKDAKQGNILSFFKRV